MDEQPINCIFTSLAINNRASERCTIPAAKPSEKTTTKVKVCLRKSQGLVLSCAFQGNLIPMNDSL